MTALELHAPADPAQVDAEDLFVPASKDGDDVSGPPGYVLLFVRNRLKRKPRSVTVCWEPAGTHTLTVGPKQTLTIGPFGLTDLHGGIVLEDEINVSITYPVSRGLEVFAMKMAFLVS